MFIAGSCAYPFSKLFSIFPPFFLSTDTSIHPTDGAVQEIIASINNGVSSKPFGCSV